MLSRFSNSKAFGRLLCAVACLAVLGGCGIDPDPGLVAATSPDGRGAIRPLPAPTGCTRTVTDNDALDEAMAAAQPGDRVCLLGKLRSTRLVLKRSGTAQKPIELVGDGNTILRGINVEANFVRISGVNVLRPTGPGISLQGNSLILENSTVLSPRGGDGDGLRFFGENITIRHNTIRDTRHLDGAHADCMQTFATDDEHVASRNVRVTDNRCEKISNICLIAEGPHSSAGDGSGVGESADFLFSNNYCQYSAYQAVMLDDIKRMTITRNEVYTKGPKAWAFQNNSTFGLIKDNVIGPDVEYEVGMDDSSKLGYRGPEVGGIP
ncbi:hypothetical protein GCM10023321_51130 [Pseudonocardia eucalypti]|uniref:Right handed beta helix domain-containing protein n=1 Tax=Pseudonocardia eucalypti TaxID=648755 RepID=A0ABP9QL83_9PSEU|nr:hypothetical protein [Pseudonocardia eucalypti]